MKPFCLFSDFRSDSCLNNSQTSIEYIFYPGNANITDRVLCDGWMVLQMKVKSCALRVLSSVCFGGFYFLPNNLDCTHFYRHLKKCLFLQTAMAVPDPLISQVIYSSSSSPGHGI